MPPNLSRCAAGRSRRAAKPPKPPRERANHPGETTDGTRFASRLDDYPSRGPAGDPMTHAELWTKFADCAERSLPRAGLSAAFDTLMGIASLPSVHNLTALLRPDHGVRAA